MQTYSLKKEDAYSKLNSLLSLSCLYNIIPENIDTVKIFDKYLFI